MKIKDLHLLPKFRDGMSYLYVEHCRVDREAKAVAVHDASGVVPVPCANLALIMLGPGVSITHAAIMTLADNGCLAAWCGEEGVRFYASGQGKTRSARNLLAQAKLWADPKSHMEVARRMYSARFSEQLPEGLSLRQIRGKEGIRVREAYARESLKTGVEWTGRNYKKNSWNSADPVNRALSAANSCLYGLCHAAILSSGFSAALGFIHTGKMLSFVYDIADLYKTEISIPAAFGETALGEDNLERRVRIACRDLIASSKLLKRVIDDIYHVLGMAGNLSQNVFVEDDAGSGMLWDAGRHEVGGGINYGEEKTENDDNDSRPGQQQSPR